MPELAHEIEKFEPEPDPMQVRLQELEIAKLEAEIEKIQSETVENLAEAELDGAKAREADSIKDQKDLDFVEQESGTTQEREKEKLAVQAQGNIELEKEKRKTGQITELSKYLSGGGEK